MRMAIDGPFRTIFNNVDWRFFPLGRGSPPAVFDPATPEMLPAPVGSIEHNRPLLILVLYLFNGDGLRVET